jgi:hypothetical protein
MERIFAVAVAGCSLWIALAGAGCFHGYQPTLAEMEAANCGAVPVNYRAIVEAWFQETFGNADNRIVLEFPHSPPEKTFLRGRNGKDSCTCAYAASANVTRGDLGLSTPMRYIFMIRNNNIISVFVNGLAHSDSIYDVDIQTGLIQQRDLNTDWQPVGYIPVQELQRIRN